MADNPKFRNSEFFDFMQKVSTGELRFENNDVVQGIVSFLHVFPGIPASSNQYSTETDVISRFKKLRTQWHRPGNKRRK
jgi:hypothetical protein